MAHDVFISHSAKDKTISDATCAWLERHGIRCWVAPRDIRPGDTWGNSIVKAIRSSRVMVLVFSAHANASPQIMREVERAVNAGVTLIPMRIEEVMPEGDLDYFLSAAHWLDAFHSPLEDHLDQLAAVIHEVLQLSPPQSEVDAASSAPVVLTPADAVLEQPSAPSTPEPSVPVPQIIPTPRIREPAMLAPPESKLGARVGIFGLVVFGAYCGLNLWYYVIQRPDNILQEQTTREEAAVTPEAGEVPVTDITPLDVVQRRAEAGDAVAQNELGVRYFKGGNGLQKDYAQALSWLQKAAAQGYWPSYDAIGVMYEQGQGVTQDYTQALSCFQKAAANGNEPAEYNIGMMYEQGQGVTKDYAQALLWYGKAANKGLVAAQLIIGNIYYSGQGVTQDYAQAFSWYKKAADQGNPTGQYDTGLMYENGSGVGKDIVQAVVWYRKAAAQNNSDAVAALKRLGYSATP